MSEELSAFRAELLAEVKTLASADGNFMHTAFVERAGELLEEAEEIFDFASCYYRGTGSRHRSSGVDGYAFDDADESLRCVIAEFSGGPELPTLNQTTARGMFGRAQTFVEDSLSGRNHAQLEESTPAYDLAREIQRRATGVSKCRFFLVTDSVLSERVRDWPEAEVAGMRAEFHIWDVSRFHRLRLSKTGRDELYVDFRESVPGGVPGIQASMATTEYAAYLCVLPGRALADIYDKYGSRLLEGNVRSFLSATGKINKGIRATILKEPGMFFAYNNGIACTASALTLNEESGALRIEGAKDFQIVNGGQTTASLANARRRDGASLDGTFVQMKLSVIDNETSGAIIPRISRYANSQNRVSDADFFSNHDYHRLLESISRRLRAPARAGAQIETFWFYERARGSTPPS